MGHSEAMVEAQKGVSAWTRSVEPHPSPGDRAAPGGSRRLRGAADGESRTLKTWASMHESAALVAAAVAALCVPVIFHTGNVEAPRLKAAFEAAITLVEFAAAGVLCAQFLRSRRSFDLLLFGGAALLGAVTLVGHAIPAAFGLHAGPSLAATALIGDSFAGGLFATAAITPLDRNVTSTRRALAGIAAVVLGVVAAALGALLLGVRTGGPTRAAGITGGAVLHTPVLVLVLAATGWFLFAAVAFARRPGSDSAVLAIVGIALAGSSLRHFVPPPITPDTLDLSDALHALAFALILFVGLRNEVQARSQIRRAAVLAERWRVARDLHDGLAQDLAFIAAHGPAIAPGVGETHPVVVAAKRALAVSRSTISELSTAAGVTAQESLEAVAQELSDRFRIAITVQAPSSRDIPCETKDHLTQIAREAIANAARHGDAKNVSLSLRTTDAALVLTILDDGRGMQPARHAAGSERFGLRSMQQRAAGLGGYVTIRAARRGGTEVEVVIP